LWAASEAREAKKRKKNEIKKDASVFCFVGFAFREKPRRAKMDPVCEPTHEPSRGTKRKSADEPAACSIAKRPRRA
jgi:hypothetical protein